MPPDNWGFRPVSFAPHLFRWFAFFQCSLLPCGRCPLANNTKTDGMDVSASNAENFSRVVASFISRRIVLLGQVLSISKPAFHYAAWLTTPPLRTTKSMSAKPRFSEQYTIHIPTKRAEYQCDRAYSPRCGPHRQRPRWSVKRVSRRRRGNWRKTSAMRPDARLNRRVTRTTNLLERLFLEERRRTNHSPRVLRTAVLKLTFAAILRASQSWLGTGINDFEPRQLHTLREELER